jgi:cytochrome c5
MSDKHISADHDAHGAAEPSILKRVSSVIVLAFVPLVIVLSLINQYKANDSGANATLMTEVAITARIQKIGVLSMGEAVHELKTGEGVFKAQCTTCHTAGMLGAPKFGDVAAWAPRIKSGYVALLNSALKGKNNMTAQGGGAFSDYEVARAVVYMANAGGAKFDEPAAPVGTAEESPTPVATTK